LLILYFSPLSAASLEENNTLVQQRELYLQAEKSLRSGSTRVFDKHRKQLQNYPLFPYLEYIRLNHRLTLDNRAEVDDYLGRYPDLWLSDRLRRNWLNLLYRSRQWQLYTSYFNLANTSTTAQCHYYFSRYQLGDLEGAIDGGLKLWIAGQSQPKSCDPLFKVLISEQRITNRVAWQRYTLAIRNHKFNLARYIERFFSGSKYQAAARHYLSVDRNPAGVGDYQLLDSKTPEFLGLIEHGIRHLAKQNTTLAIKHWSHYLQTHPFDEAARRRMLPSLVKGLYRQGYEDVAASYLNENIEFSDPGLLEWQLRNMIHKEDWAVIASWVANLPEHIQEQERWRYWRARALLLHTTSVEEIDSAKTTLRELSRFRSFYGFLASDWVSNPYRMQHEPVAIDEIQIKDMENLPGILRARELVFHQQLLNARREWYAVGRSFNSQQWQVAARIAQKWQWHQQVILAMSKAPYWNDIDLRFPLAYRREFEVHAKKQNLPLPLVLAIARQESAFSPDVVSPAGAYGLMQLMPATAKEVSRKYKIAYRGRTQLGDPELNIHLGSQYYKSVLKRFGNNRILATASYNAGPTRTQQWLKKSSGKLPFDAWVETIPFNETRQYVQNVLAFAVIYSHHLNRDDTLLTTKERGTLL
jgi:soluble lytic murein transglycosylase